MSGNEAFRIHGMGHERVAPDWAPWTEAEARALLADYPAAGAVQGLLFLSPRPFSAAAVVATTNGDVFIKRHHHAVRDAAGLGEEHRFIAHLAARGLPVPAVLANAQGESVTMTGPWTCEVHRRAAGRDLYRDALSWTPFARLGHARSAGRMLARLHLAAEGYRAPPRAVRPLVSSCSIITAADPAAALERYVAARPALADFLAGRPWRQEILGLCRPLFQRFQPYGDLVRPLWTHNDFHASNLTWAGADGREEAQEVFDFGLADRCFALYDLATAIERNAVGWLERPFRTEVEQAAALIAGYAELRPLGPRDRAALAALLPLVHLEFALAEVDYFEGLTRVRQNALLAYEGYLLGHAEWFLSREGQAFLAHIVGGQ